MGNIGDFFRPKQVPGAHTVYTLTELGKQKAETYTAETPWCEVLAYLNDTNIASINEISKDRHIAPKKVRLIVTNMINSGYVRRANSQGE